LETRSPALYAVASAVSYFGPGAARSGSVTSSTLSTAGSRRECGTTVSRRARSGRSSVTVKKETQGRDRAVDARRLHTALHLVQLEATQIFCRRRVGRPADKGRERPDVLNIIAPRLLAEAAPGDALDHARLQAADGPTRGMGGHQGSSLELKVAGLSMLGTGRPDRHVLPRITPLKNAPTVTRAPSRATGFVLRRQGAIRHVAVNCQLFANGGVGSN